MFVHSGAGLHGHEFSSRATHPPSQTQNHRPQPRPLPLLRSALRPVPDSIDSRFSADPQLPRPSTGRRSYTDPVSDRPLPRRPVSDIVSKKDLAVRFLDPLMESSAPSVATLPSEDDESVAESDFSGFAESSAPRRRSRKAPRKTTRYALAHPAPQLRTKQRMLVQFRPRLLLQLQHLSQNQRPIPAFDVLPSSSISGSILIPWFTKKRIFGAKPELRPDDLLFVHSEDYRAGSSGTDSSHDGLEHRDLMAVVSPLPNCDDNNAEMVMGDGSTWTTSLMVNGSYEFTRIDSQGRTTTARWVRKPNRVARQSTDPTDTSPRASPQLSEDKWTFSIIDPSTRRHPIMGVLNSHELILYDTYSTMSASSGRYPPTRPLSGAFSAGGDSIPQTPTSPREERSTEVVPEEYKQLMTVTASWISLRQEGWPASANPKFSRRVGPHCRSASLSLTERRRTFPVSEVSSPPTSPVPIAISHQSDGVASPIDEKVPPKRAVSTGAKYMRRRRMVASESLEHKPEDVKQASPSINAEEPLIGHAPDEKTHTCRIRVRRLTQKLFGRRSCSSH